MLTLAPALALLISQMWPRTAGSLPLFSRQHGTPCSECHIAFPRLNAAGMAFRQSGYRRAGEKGQPPWVTREFPLSVIGSLGVTVSSTDAVDSTGRRQRFTEGRFERNAVDFHSAGTLAQRVSFHFEESLAADNASLATRAAFVQFDDALEHGALNVKVGVYDVEFPFLSNSRRTTLQGYLSPVTLDGRGVELNGTESDWTYAAGLINSHRDRLRVRPGTNTINQLEDTYLSLMRDLDGQLVAARMFFDRQDSNLPMHEWLQHLQAVLSACLSSGRFELIPGYTLNRFDDRPSAGIHDRHQIGLLEALAVLDQERRWVITARYEHEYRTRTVSTPEEDHQLGALNLGYSVNPNARVALEWARSGDNIAGPRINKVDAYVHVGY